MRGWRSTSATRSLAIDSRPRTPTPFHRSFHEEVWEAETAVGVVSAPYLSTLEAPPVVEATPRQVLRRRRQVCCTLRPSAVAVSDAVRKPLTYFDNLGNQVDFTAVLKPEARRRPRG